MINIVFEGAPGAGKTTIINEVVKKLKSFGIKVENTVDIDPTTPLYPILHNMNCTRPLITSNIELSSGSSSISTCPNTKSGCSASSFSRRGCRALQGPHQVAKKSTITGTLEFRTSS